MPRPPKLPAARGADRSAELAAVQQRIRERSPLSADRTEEIIAVRFDAIPNRLSEALDRWPLASSRVLDVGCSYGNTPASSALGRSA
jgi:hypothetical protein